MLSEKEFRAKQFMPFMALKGFDIALKKSEILKTNKKVISEYIENELNNKIKTIKKLDNVTITYYDLFSYVETTGIVKQIDTINKYIVIGYSKIYFSDILDIIKK